MSETTHERATATGRGGGAASGQDLTPTELAARHGLSVSGARPSFPEYLRQLWGRRHFIRSFSQAKMTAQYSQAKLGQIWQMLTPLLNVFVYFLIFGLLMGGRGNMTMEEYVPFLVIGIFLYTFTQQSVMAGVKAIPSNLGLVRALHFPRASLPLSFVLQQLQQLMLSLVIMLGFLLAFGHFPMWTWLLIFPILALQLVLNIGLGLVFGRLGSQIPDLAQLMPFVLRVIMYGSGVLFPLHYTIMDRTDAPEWVADVLIYNPVSVFLELARYVLLDGPAYESLHGSFWLAAAGYALVTFVVGFVYFWKAEEQYGRG